MNQSTTATWPTPEPHDRANKRETRNALSEILKLTGWTEEDALAEATWLLHAHVDAHYSFGQPLRPSAVMTPAPKRRR